MVRWTWLTWPDPLVDFGRELYTPWRLSEGDALYGDVACLFGPLSQCVNSLWFRWFGVGLTTLVFANLVLLLLLISLLYLIFAEVSSQLASTLACLAFVLLFACAQYVPIGNYNYLCPYSHEMTHGMLLSLAALAAEWRVVRRPCFWSALAGTALGACLLTKVEVAAAAALGVALHRVIYMARRRKLPTACAASTALLAAATIAPMLMAGMLFSAAMPASEAAHHLIAPWLALFQSDVVQLPFYRRGMGLDNLADNVTAMFGWAFAYIAFLGIAVAFCRRTAKEEGRGYLRAALLVLLVAVLVTQSTTAINWFDAFRPLPLAMFAIVTVCFFGLRTHWQDDNRAARFARQLSLGTFAIALLAKMALNCRIYHYGFVLAMPATLLSLVALANWLPGWLARRGRSPLVFRAISLGLAVGLIFVYHERQALLLREKKYEIGHGADTIHSDLRGSLINEVLGELEQAARASDTVALLPEGVMINYLARLRNPTPYVNFMPPEMLLFGEETILRSLQSSPPEWIALVHKDTSEYGVRYFGVDYGREVAAWIGREYRPVRLFGAPPLRDANFGILLLRRKRDAS